MGSHPLGNHNPFHEITLHSKGSGFPWRDQCVVRGRLGMVLRLGLPPPPAGLPGLAWDRTSPCLQPARETCRPPGTRCPQPHALASGTTMLPAPDGTPSSRPRRPGDRAAMATRGKRGTTRAGHHIRPEPRPTPRLRQGMPCRVGLPVMGHPGVVRAPVEGALATCRAPGSGEAPPRAGPPWMDAAYAPASEAEDSPGMRGRTRVWAPRAVRAPRRRRRRARAPGHHPHDLPPRRRLPRERSGVLLRHWASDGRATGSCSRAAAPRAEHDAA